LIQKLHEQEQFSQALVGTDLARIEKEEHRIRQKKI